MKYWGVLGFLFILGCQNNPYTTTEGEYHKNRPLKHEVPETYAIDSLEMIEFTEGMKGQFLIQGYVPLPGKPILTFEGLPEGAEYDSELNRIIWVPSMKDGDSQTDPYKLYKVLVTVQSTANSKKGHSKIVTFLVHNKVGDFYTDPYSQNSSVTEGSELHQEIPIHDDEYPNGPFKIYTATLPENTTVSIDPDKNKIVIDYKPNYNVTKRSVQFDWSLVLINPIGKMVELTGRWLVIDKLIEPQIVAPGTITTDTLVAKFVIAIEDRTGTALPELAFDVPETGNITLNTLATSQENVNGQQYTYRVIEVVWDGNPETLYQTEQKLNYTVLVTNQETDEKISKANTITVQFIGAAPTTGGSVQ